MKFYFKWKPYLMSIYDKVFRFIWQCYKTGEKLAATWSHTFVGMFTLDIIYHICLVLINKTVAFECAAVALPPKLCQSCPAHLV